MGELQFPGLAEQQQAHADSEQPNTDGFQTACLLLTALNDRGSG